MAPDYAIETEGLVKVYRTLVRRRKVRAVDGVSLRVGRGTTFGLLGPNGAGKTTFVKLLLSAVHPTAGGARLFGRDARQPEARRPVGYLPENHRFPTYFTGAGMLDFYAALSGMAARERKRRAAELLALVELDRWGDVRVGKYSKGMLQRLGLAQALMHRPSLLILDEPSDGVDPIGRRRIREVLHRLEEQGVTIFINSHLLGEVEQMCREVAILHRGQVALVGSVKELTAGRGYRLSLARAGQRLIDELRAEASSCSVDGERAVVMLADRASLNRAIDAARAAGAEIESAVASVSTLEEVFVRTVEGK